KQMDKSRISDMMKLSFIFKRGILSDSFLQKLFYLLVDRDISNSELQKMASFSGNIMTRMKREQHISLESVEKIYKILNGKVDNILEITSKKKERTELAKIKKSEEKDRNTTANNKEMTVLKERFPACFKEDGSFDVERLKDDLSEDINVVNEGYE